MGVPYPLPLELGQADFLSVVRNAPLVSIDLVIKNHRGEILLGLRRNQPARGFWFVPGGRIHKGQSIETAFTAIANREIGISADISGAVFLGVYEHFYDTNFFENDGFGTHFVTLGYQIMLDDIDPQRLPYDQHDLWKWFALSDLKINPDVHSNTKRYFNGCC